MFNAKKLNLLISTKIHKILSYFNMEYYEEYGGKLRGCCQHHLGDNPTAFCIYEDDKNPGVLRWHCFTRGCQEKYGSDMIGMVSGLKKCYRQDVYDFIKGFNFDIDYEGELKKLGAAKLQNSKTIVDEINPYVQKIYDECVNNSEYFQERGFSLEVIKEFGCKTCVNRNSIYYNRVIVPVINQQNKIVGLTARWNGSKVPDNEMKWRHSSFKKGEMLFNENRAFKFSGKLIIVEGPLDVMKMWMAGYKNVVGLLGSRMSMGHATKLMYSNFYSLVIALDPDFSGDSGVEKIKKHLGDYFTIDIKRPPEGKDVGSLNTAELQALFGEQS